MIDCLVPVRQIGNSKVVVVVVVAKWKMESVSGGGVGGKRRKETMRSWFREFLLVFNRNNKLQISTNVFNR